MIVAMALAVAPLACGAVTRPGIAEFGADGRWRGRAVELCQAAAAWAGGPQATIVFHGYDSLAALRRADADRIAFGSAAELAIAPLATTLYPGPVVAVDRQVLVVPATSPARSPRDLAGRMICFIIGSRAEDALDRWSLAAAVPIERLGFQEEDEMADAYDVGKCAGLAVDAQEAPSREKNRILSEALASTPIIAATPVADGDAWRRLVAMIASPSGDGALSHPDYQQDHRAAQREGAAAQAEQDGDRADTRVALDMMHGPSPVTGKHLRGRSSSAA